jgi:predicted HAD superfamily Cof-like phosphohydrolase
MSKFTDYIDSFADKTSTLAKDELKELILSAKKDEYEFVRLQAVNIEHWTVMLAAGEITPAGFKRLVTKMDVLTELETIKLEVAAKASAQRLADGIQTHVIDGLCRLI